MKAHELPEKYKQYILTLSNKNEYKITGETKQKILASKTNFVELANGNVINKAFIVSIDYSSLETQRSFRFLPIDMQQKLITNLDATHRYGLLE